jgi:putative MATE family efflux protein
VPPPDGRPRWRSPHDREIARLAIPAFGALIAEPLYVLTDTAIVGHLGTPELGGLAVASSILLTLYAVFIFLAYGTTAAVSRLVGAGDQRAATAEGVQALWLALGIGVVLTLVGLLFAEPMVELMGAEGAVRANALLYLRISLLGVPALLLTLAGTGYLRGEQDTVTPLVVAAATAVANLVLEVVLIFGFDLGIGASALSTVLVQVCGALAYLWRVGRSARAQEVGLRPHAASLRRLARVGVDLLVRTAALRAALLVTTAVATRMGDVDVAAQQIAFEVWSFLALGLDAVAIAGQALVGRSLGAGEGAGARSAGRRMIEWGVALGVAFGLLTIAVRGPLAGVFTDDAAVESLAAFLLVWVGALQPVNAVAFVLDGVLIGAGDLRFLAQAMVGSLVAYVPLAVAVGTTDAGIGWLWAALGVFMATRAGALLARFAGDRWVVLGATRQNSVPQ